MQVVLINLAPLTSVYSLPDLTWSDIRHRAIDGCGQQAAGYGHNQRDDDRGCGVDAQPVYRRHSH